MPDVVISAVLYSNGVLRATTRADDGSTTEHDWFAVVSTGLPAIELPAGALIRAFLASGGRIGTADAATYLVPNFTAPEPIPVPEFTQPPAPSTDFPEEISDRQFFQQLAIDEIISEDEAEATAGGAIPSSLLDAINTRLPVADQFSARMLVRNAKTFQRHHPMTVALGRIMLWSDARMDALWNAASKL